MKHAFVSSKAAASDSTIVDGPKWNAAHVPEAGDYDDFYVLLNPSGQQNVDGDTAFLGQTRLGKLPTAPPVDIAANGSGTLGLGTHHYLITVNNQFAGLPYGYGATTRGQTLPSNTVSLTVDDQSVNGAIALSWNGARFSPYITAGLLGPYIIVYRDDGDGFGVLAQVDPQSGSPFVDDGSMSPDLTYPPPTEDSSFNLLCIPSDDSGTAPASGYMEIDTAIIAIAVDGLVMHTSAFDVTVSNIASPSDTRHFGFTQDGLDATFPAIALNGPTTVKLLVETAIAALSADTTLDTTYRKIEATGGVSGITLTLPSPTGNKGRQFRITKVDSGAGAVTISGTINGDSSYVLSNQYQFVEVEVRNDESGYFVCGLN